MKAKKGSKYEGRSLKKWEPSKCSPNKVEGWLDDGSRFHMSKEHFMEWFEHEKPEPKPAPKKPSKPKEDK